MVRCPSRVPHRYRWDCWASGPWLQPSHNWHSPAILRDSVLALSSRPANSPVTAQPSCLAGFLGSARGQPRPCGTWDEENQGVSDPQGPSSPGSLQASCTRGPRVQHRTRSAGGPAAPCSFIAARSRFSTTSLKVSTGIGLRWWCASRRRCTTLRPNRAGLALAARGHLSRGRSPSAARRGAGLRTQVMVPESSATAPSHWGPF